MFHIEIKNLTNNNTYDTKKIVLKVNENANPIYIKGIAAKSTKETLCVEMWNARIKKSFIRKVYLISNKLMAEILGDLIGSEQCALAMIRPNIDDSQKFIEKSAKEIEEFLQKENLPHKRSIQLEESKFLWWKQIRKYPLFIFEAPKKYFEWLLQYVNTSGFSLWKIEREFSGIAIKVLVDMFTFPDLFEKKVNELLDLAEWGIESGYDGDIFRLVTRKLLKESLLEKIKKICLQLNVEAVSH